MLSPENLSYLGEGKGPGDLNHWVGDGEERRLWVHPDNRCILEGAVVGNHAESQ